jgi:hypothetical protein
MAATAADTHREITRLRGDMNAALDELQRRLRGGLRTVASTEARVTSTRARQDAMQSARQNPTLAGVVGVVVVGAVGYLAYRAISGRRERQKPQNRLKRGVQQARAELVGRVSEGVELSKKQLDQARQRGLLLKLEPEDGGYIRVTDARLEALAIKSKGRSDVIKKLVWAGLLSVFMAVSSVLARRVAGGVWRATVREDPPTQKPKSAS